jgi:hypothetical protein
MCFGTMDPYNAQVARQHRGRGRGQRRQRQQQRQVISDPSSSYAHTWEDYERSWTASTPNLSHYMVASIVRTFRRENWSFALLLL